MCGTGVGEWVRTERGVVNRKPLVGTSERWGTMCGTRVSGGRQEKERVWGTVGGSRVSDDVGGAGRL